MKVTGSKITRTILRVKYHEELEIPNKHPTKKNSLVQRIYHTLICPID